MDQLASLVERTRREQWPPLTTSAIDLRRRASRRRWRRGAALLTLSLAGIVATGTGLTALTGSDEGTVRSTPSSQSTEESVRVLGVGLTMPIEWGEGRTEGTSSSWRTCLGPSEEIGNCPVFLSVAVDPAGVLTSGGVDAVQELTATCRPNDPRIVLLEDELVIDGYRARHYVARCTSSSDSKHAWVLDSGALAITARDARLSSQAARIFASLKIPDSWPEVVHEPPSSTTPDPLP